MRMIRIRIRVRVRIKDQDQAHTLKDISRFDITGQTLEDLMVAE